MTLITRKPALCIPGALKKGAIRHAHPYYVIYRVPAPPPFPPRFQTFYGAGSVEKKNNPEGCRLIVFPDLVRSVLMHIPLHRCLVTFGALWLFLTVLWVGLQSVLVVFPDHSTYFLHTHPYFN